MATVFIPAVFRPLCGGAEQVQADGRTLRQLIDNLDAKHPGLKAQLVVDDAIRPGLAIAINDEMSSGGLVDAVPEGAEVRILPALGGG